MLVMVGIVLFKTVVLEKYGAYLLEHEFSLIDAAFDCGKRQYGPTPYRFLQSTTIRIQI
ncbi:hypothetical protein JXA31_02920 [Candidatus Bathyarchaeota archaeon]|nr:hypothetical protein [Candidatus Bathyarchaeota archaeon]